MELEEKYNKLVAICNMKKVCELAGISYDTYNSYRTGRRKMPDDVKKKIIDTVTEYLN